MISPLFRGYSDWIDHWLYAHLRVVVSGRARDILGCVLIFGLIGLSPSNVTICFFIKCHLAIFYSRGPGKLSPRGGLTILSLPLPCTGRLVCTAGTGPNPWA